MTNMDIPLGHYIGNALEVMEAVQVLRGEGCADLRAVCVELASNMLMLCNGWDEAAARARVEDAIASGAAFETMKKWIAAQGGDARALEDFSLLPQASIVYEVKAPRSGYIRAMDTQKVGEASAVLGAGRQKKEDVIDYAAGIVLSKKTGDYVEAGETLATLYTNQAQTLAGSETLLLDALRWGEEAPAQEKLILGIVR